LYSALKDIFEFDNIILCLPLHCHITKYQVKCFVDVDEKKINRGFYTNKELPKTHIPIVHFTALKRESYREEHDCVEQFSRIIKRKCESYKSPTTSVVKKSLNANEAFRHLPVVVCVAMYRTNGALESNVKSIERQEGVDLWYFS
jgi:hypothetical protein